jgi:hypothetical protein
MKIWINLLFLNALLAYLSGCNTNKKTSKVDTPMLEASQNNQHPLDVPDAAAGFNKDQHAAYLNDHKLLLRFEKTACFGECPVYTVYILENGYGYIEGKANTEWLGLYGFMMPKHQLNTIFKFADDIQFFGLDNQYDLGIPDFPSTITQLTLGDKTKSIIHVSGGPESLQNFQTFIIENIKSNTIYKIQ